MQRKWRSSATSSSPAREKNKLPRAKAILLFDLMEKFAGYGFNSRTRRRTRSSPTRPRT